ncbi:unnamed protein product [Chrysoparadoxa australica]
MDAHRAFCGVLEEEEIEREVPCEPKETATKVTFEAACTQFRNSLVGRNHPIQTPYGSVPLVYADYTATGRPLAIIERYLADEVLPFYANTHTTTSITGSQSTCFRHEARQIIAESVNARISGRAAEDVVIFTGTGCTAGITKLVTALGLKQAAHAAGDNASERPVVFVGPFEHHSNLLPWRESIAQVVTIKESTAGGIDRADLEAQLKQYMARPLKIGSFSAASNVTGVVAEVDAITAQLHRAGAYAFWDYATAAPHCRIDVNPVVLGNDAALVYKDAIFFSGHKFVGGPGTPGVLVCKKALLATAVPSAPGGGTVFYVTNQDHRFLSNKVEREEGGTPDIVGSIRLGLCVQLKERLGSNALEAREAELVALAMKELSQEANLCLLGPKASSPIKRLPVFSFLIRSCRAGSESKSNSCGNGSGLFLHYNFVCALLNDLFGIQSRGGCVCAGPYSQALLGLNLHAVREVERVLLSKHELLRPGFTRISMTFLTSQAEAMYILGAVRWVARHGRSFLRSYKCNHKTGEWKHTTRFTRFPERKWLGNFGYGSLATPQLVLSLSDLCSHLHRANSVAEPAQAWTDMPEEALYQQAMAAAEDELKALHRHAREDMFGSEAEHLRWFSYPWESVDGGELCMLGGERDPGYVVIDPDRYEPGVSEQYATAATSEGSPEGLGAMASDLHSTQGNGSAGVVAEATGAAQAAQLKGSSVGTGGGDVPAAPVPAPALVDAGAHAEAEANNGSDSREGFSKATDDHKYPRRSSVSSLSSHTSGHALPSGSSIKNSHSLQAQLFPKPSASMLKTVMQAMKEWNMVENGDRLCIGLSGGKDSLSLLHALIAVRKRAPIKFEIACATVDPQTPSYDPSPLIPYLEQLGITYHYLSEPIVEKAHAQMIGDSLCAFCSRMKRGLLYTCCRENGYNKLVLGQHLDDLAESFIMSAFNNGQLRTMKANYLNDAADISVIRPLAYTRESETKLFAQRGQLPVINENCPACFEQPKERHRVKKMLAREESLDHELYGRLRRTILPLMDDRVYRVMSAVTDSAKARGRKKGAAKGKKEGSEESYQVILQALDQCHAAAQGGKAEAQQCSSGDYYCVPCHELA